MAAFIILFFALLVAVPFAAFWAVKGLYRLWETIEPDRWGKRIALLLFGAIVLGSPYWVWKLYELNFVLSRVPEPLKAIWIEYRLEEDWGGLGLPGDNETGFVVYRLTGHRRKWAQSKGAHLGAFLAGGETKWHPTPVDESGWHNPRHQRDNETATRNHKPTIAEYLNKYGFSIRIQQGQDAEANRAIQNPGSFYSYGKGGSITIVDPAMGKVYFAYAG